MNEKLAPISGADGGGDEFTLADIVEHLFAEFEGDLPLALIVATIRRSRRELEIETGLAAHLGRVELVARRRLSSYADTAGGSG